MKLGKVLPPLIALGGLLLFGTVAHAQSSGSDGSVPPHLNGPCEVTATISETGAVIDPSASGGVYTVPVSGSASYSGSIAVPPEDRSHNGSVWVVTPPGIPSVTIKTWSDPDTDTVSDAGSVSWDLPDALPRGINMTVEGFHNDVADCDGSIKVKIEGDILDSPAGAASLALTLVTGAGLLFAGVPRPR